MFGNLLLWGADFSTQVMFQTVGCPRQIYSAYSQVTCTYGSRLLHSQCENVSSCGDGGRDIKYLKVYMSIKLT